MSELLFNEFSPVSSKQWKQRIQYDLKGADYNDTLIWKTNEDLDVKPYYHAEDLKNTPHPPLAKASEWNIAQSIFVAHEKLSNAKALDAIERGAESIKFIIPSETISLAELLKDIDTNSVLLYFELQFLSPDFVKKLTALTKSSNCYIFTDIIGHLAKSGNWFENLQEDHRRFEHIVEHTKTFSIDISLYQNAGANMVQQLAYAMAHANEYLNHLDNTVNKVTKSTLNVVFKVAVGSNYFFEIAKLRALRWLWESLVDAYGMNANCLLFVEPTKRNKTLYDYNNNMLRTTTECMSAILGGANTICNLPYDAIYHKDNEFGERISRNQLLILKHESYFDKVNNPAAGSYYIETLTRQLAEKAMELFKHIEAHGGFLKQLKESTIQRKIAESAAKEQQQFDDGEDILLGSNKYTNPSDRMKNTIELYPFLKINKRKTLIEPVIEKRLSETLEQDRLNKET